MVAAAGARDGAGWTKIAAGPLLHARAHQSGALLALREDRKAFSKRREAMWLRMQLYALYVGNKVYLL
jgi:hypothetical protein